MVHDSDLFPAEAAKPVITAVSGRYNGIFLKGISANNDYTAKVQWNGTPGTVEFYANNTLKATVPGTAGGAAATFDMGQDFPGRFSAYANKVRVIARNSEGGVSAPFEKRVSIIPLPEATAALTPWFSVQSTDNEVHLAVDFDFPEPPIKQTIDLPVLGKFGAEVAANASFDYTVTDGDWEAALGVGAKGAQGKRGRRPLIPGITRSPKIKLYIGNKEISGRIEGLATGTATVANGITFDDVSLNVGAGTKLELGRVGVPQMLPGLSGMISKIPGLKGFVDTLSAIIYLDLAANGAGVFALDPRFKFDHLEMGGDFGLEAAYEPKLPMCEMRLYVGGKPGFTFQIPGEFIKELRCRVYAGAEFKAWLITLGPFEYVFVNVRIPEQGGQTAMTKTLAYRVAVSEGTAQKPIDRSYLKDGAPRFVVYEPLSLKTTMAAGGKAAGEMSRLEAFRAMRPGTSKQTLSIQGVTQQPVLLQADLPLIENVFPYSEPALADRGSELMLLYVSDNGASGELQFTDINWLRFDGTDWTEPAPIVSDTRAESSPKVAFDGNGDAVAMWERVKDPDFNTVDIEAMAAQMEIVWSHWDHLSGNWNTPVPITDNNCLDHNPILCGPMTDGSVLAVWTQNQANLLMGDANNPSSVLWTKWDPNSHNWSTPQTLVTALPYRLSESFAGAGSKAVYAWTRDMNGDVNTPDDQELFICQWDGTNWSSPSQLTNDAMADRNVRVAVSGSSDAYMVWQRVNNLVMDRNLRGTPSIVVRENSQTVAFMDYAMTVGPAGNLVLLWQEQSKEGVDAFYSVYDPASERWSKDNRIFADAPLERSFAPVWDDVGNLTVAYNRVDIQMTNKRVELEGGEIVDINNVPTPGRVDLGIFKRAIVKDLAIKQGDFTIEGTTYLPGDPIRLSANVSNTGDTSEENITVAFYDGNPGSGGIEIGRQVVGGWLDGATSGTAEITWPVTAPAGLHTIYAMVDPNGHISEVNEDNNLAFVNIGGTDLVPTLLSAKAQQGGSARIIVEVQNIGAPAAQQTTLALRRIDQNEPAISTVAVPALSPGRMAQVSLDLPEGTLSPGSVAFTITADDSNEVNDVDRGNNRITFSIYYPQAGDLDLDGYVGILDLATFISHWLETGCSDPNWCGQTDFNRSGSVDFVDFAILAEKWLWGFKTNWETGDFDNNGLINWADLKVFVAHWLEEGCTYPAWCEGADLNSSGKVEFSDFAVLARRWLEGE